VYIYFIINVVPIFLSYIRYKVPKRNSGARPYFFPGRREGWGFASVYGILLRQFLTTIFYVHNKKHLFKYQKSYFVSEGEPFLYSITITEFLIKILYSFPVSKTSLPCLILRLLFPALRPAQEFFTYNIWRCHHCRWRAVNLCLCSTIRVFE
jgi:hypothetical protein